MSMPAEQPVGTNMLRLGGTIAGGSMLGGSIATLIASGVAASGGFPVVVAGAALGALAGLGLALASGGEDRRR